MIKGQVVDLRSKGIIPLTNIKVTNTGKIFACGNDGTFTLYVSKYDTLRFSSTGYIPKVIHVSDLDSTKYYTLEIELIRDFIKLKEVTIYPFKDKEEFKDAFMAAKDVNKITLPGIDPPKYSNQTPKAKFNNPISFIYERAKKKRAANPDFKP